MKPSKKILNAIRRIQIAQIKLYKQEDIQPISICITSHNKNILSARYWYVYCYNFGETKIWRFNDDTSKDEIRDIINELMAFLGFNF